MANVYIPREHQAAPADTWADKEVNKAAEEIRTGNFKIDKDKLEADGNILEAMPTGVSRGKHINMDPRRVDPMGLMDTEMLLQHPRVTEALARLERERGDAKNTQEMLEKTQQWYELNELASRKNQWDGQGRWIGEENEEMRVGKVLTPFQFLDRLESVIGKGRVFVNRFAVLNRVALLAKNYDKAPLVLLPGQPEPREDGMEQVGTLQWPCSTEWMVMRFDEYGVPTTAKYLGWRTALLSMIFLGVITEKEAHAAFPVGTSQAAEWYNIQLFEWRHRLRGQIQ